MATELIAPPTTGITRTRMGHYIVTADTSLGKHVEHCGTFEFQENLVDLVQVAAYVPEGGVVIDAGACIGDHTGMYSQMVGATGQVHALEPHPDSFRALVKNTARLNNVTCYPLGFGETRRRTWLSSTPNVGASFISVDNQFPRQTVELTTLDAFCANWPRLDVLHLDAEGMEPEILAGGWKVIHRLKPVLYVEVTDQWLRRYGSSEAQLLHQIDALGYTILKLQANPAQYDVLCLSR